MFQSARPNNLPVSPTDSPTEPTHVLPRPKPARLALQNMGTGQVLELRGDRMVLGSDPSCDIVLDDPAAAPMHAVLERRDDSWLLRDRRAPSGTWINGHRIACVVLVAGCRVTIGKTHFRVVPDEPDRHARDTTEPLLGESPAFRAALSQALRMAPTDCHVLLVGETGTGKELFAQLLHRHSTRAAQPLVAVNCGALPGELIASELFGHMRGSFTGANQDRAGYFEQAQRGTLFLDELGELPLPLQPHLLRVLETKRVRRVGGTQEVPVDVRVIAATNRLDVGAGGSSLRTDLFHRVATVVIELPALRERDDDVILLTHAFMERLAPQYGAKHLSEACLTALRAHKWPGNVRELFHAVTRAMALGGDILEPADFFEKRRGLPEDTTPRSSAPSQQHSPTFASVPLYQAELRKLMIATLEQVPSLRGAARVLGMPKSTFIHRARQLGVIAPRMSPSSAHK